VNNRLPRCLLLSTNSFPLWPKLNVIRFFRDSANIVVRLDDRHHFGASGDLTARKLIPAVYNLSFDNLLPRIFTWSVTDEKRFRMMTSASWLRTPSRNFHAAS